MTTKTTTNRFTASGLTRRSFGALAAGAALVAGIMAGKPAVAQDTIKIGELNSYSRFAAFTVPYKQGFELALEEINAAGGIGGKKLEVISRDDGATTGDAVRVAEELVTRENVAFIFGTFLSNVGLAVGDFANQKKVLFIAAEPLTDALTMAKGNRYTFRLRANTWMQVGMLVDAVKETGAKRWAIVAPNYEYGQSSAENFKALAEKAIPGFEVVAEQYPALGKIDAGSLKVKVASTIVAISSIHLLQVFLNAQQYADDKLMWLTIMHMAFVVSALFLAYIDRVMAQTKKDKGDEH